jgi:hypothetical protein
MSRRITFSGEISLKYNNGGQTNPINKTTATNKDQINGQIDADGKSATNKSPKKKSKPW